MRNSIPMRALTGGVLCLAILGGMIVGHAWPLWTGRTVVLAAAVLGKGEPHASGQYLRLSTPAMQLALDEAQNGGSAATYVKTVGAGWDTSTNDPGWGRAIRGHVVFVQLEAGADGSYAPVSVSFAPVAGATNLRGRVRGWRAGPQQGASTPRTLLVDCGLEAYYLEQGQAERVAAQIGKAGSVQMEVAIAASGQARIARLLVNGQPVS